MATATHARPAPRSGTADGTRPSRSLWRDAWITFAHDRLAVAGLIALVAITLAVALGPLVWRHTAIDFSKALEGPSLAHPFGVDDLGRDLLARVLDGGRVSITVGIVSVLLAMSLGTAIGALAGYFPKLDDPLMRVTDLFLSLPVLPLLLVLVYLFKESLQHALGAQIGIFVLVVGVIAILNWMPVARLVRASFLSLRQREFVEAARCVGSPDARIIVRHILPNVLSPVLVAATIGVGAAIITESTLSFLGLGFPSDTPTWGRLLFDSVNYLDFAPHWAIFPGLAVVTTVLAVNFIGDGLRDALDPRRKI
jgi:peptide/nickel transport system permease protein